MHPAVGNCIINQIYDELLFEFPEHDAPEFGRIACQLMIQSADHYLFQYGAYSNVEPQTADYWSK